MRRTRRRLDTAILVLLVVGAFAFASLLAAWGSKTRMLELPAVLYDAAMLFLVSLFARAVARLLVGGRRGEGLKDLEILVLRHQLQVLRPEPRIRWPYALETSTDEAYSAG